MHEAHISAKKTSKKYGARFPEKDEYVQWPQGIAAQAQKRQNGTHRVIAFIMKFTESLKKTCQFRLVYNGGRSCADRFLVLYALKNDTDRNKLGISVSRKVGKSVTRSRVTRLIREVYRLTEELITPGSDLVFIARAQAGGASFEDIRQSVCTLLKRQRLLRL